MTVRKGEKHTVESYSQFKGRLDVSDDELVQALPEAMRERLVADENAIREDTDQPPVEDPTAVHEDLLHEAVQDVGFNSVVIDVLEARDREYVHLFDGTVQKIVELYPTEDGVLP